MREIKFRAWQDEGMLIQENSGVYATKKFLDKLYEDCILMQFTGLHDKNGKEIYEGDVVMYTECNCSGADIPNQMAAVEYDEGSFVPVSEGYCAKVEVIGNIHQHPELLGESK